jgi:Uma2 family endonuclease
MAEPAYPLALPDRADHRAWPVQGEWTYEDYRLLPDDGRRYEIVRGFLYMTPAPSVDHQRAVRGLFRQPDRFVLEKGLGEVLTAPLDILLPRGIAAPVQPDLAFFRTGNEPRAGALNVQRAPDLVIEVLSPGTRRLDTRIKFETYRDAGIPELWFADPRPRTIVVYGLSEDGKRYVEICRGAEGESISSRVLSGLRLAVSEIFSPR